MQRINQIIQAGFGVHCDTMTEKQSFPQVDDLFWTSGQDCASSPAPQLWKMIMQSGWAEYFEEGEKLLWEGKPDPKIFLFDKEEKFKHILAGGWLLLMVYFFHVTGANFFEATFSVATGIPFWLLLIVLIIFAYFLIGRWILDAHERKYTVYAISNKRAFIAKSAFNKRNLRDIRITPEMQVKFKNDVLGSITFGPKPNIFQRNNKWIVEDGAFTFRGLSDAQKVLKIIADLQDVEED